MNKQATLICIAQLLHGSADSNRITGYRPNLGLTVTFDGNTSLRLQYRSQLQQDKEPRLGPRFDISLGLNITMALGGSRGHPEWQGPSDSTPTGTQVVVHTLGLCMNLMVTKAIIINTDPGCCRVKDPNMAPATTLIDQIVVCATEIYMAPDSAWPWALT